MEWMGLVEARPRGRLILFPFGIKVCSVWGTFVHGARNGNRMGRYDGTGGTKEERLDWIGICG
jgi:hypothetical protein